MEIFDKDGNEISIVNVVYNFIKTKAIENKISIEETFIGVDNSKWNSHKSTCIYATQEIEDGDGASYLSSFGNEEKVTEEFDEDHGMDQLLNDMVDDLEESHKVYAISKDSLGVIYLGSYMDISFEFACVSAIENYSESDKCYGVSNGCYLNVKFFSDYDSAHNYILDIT